MAAESKDSREINLDKREIKGDKAAIATGKQNVKADEKK
jgi:hypothetical protein